MAEITLFEKPLKDIIGTQDIIDAYANYNLPDYDKLIQELEKSGVTLDEDPSANNLSELNLKIAKIDAQKARAAAIANLATSNENELEMISSRAQSLLAHESNKLLISAEIKGLPNKELREAAVNVVLYHLRTLAEDIKSSLSRAKTFSKMVFNSVNMLDSANKNISRQITVLQLQLGIGEIGRGFNSQNKETNPHTF